MNWRRIVWLLALVTLPTLAEETPLQLVLRGAQHDQLYQLSSSGVTKVSALPDSLTTPLGSLWKLYVYAWLEDTHQPEQPYQCRGNSPEEVYCCQAGESITRDTALVRSCGLYFAPQRLHIGADVWGQYWQQRQAPAWLASLTTLKPETSVTVKSLLDSLATLPAQNKAQEVLLDVVLDEAKIGVASMLGSRVRVKTWSWFADDKQEIRQGGFAGWLTDGTPLWVTGSGTSKTVLTRYATVLNRVLPVPTQVASGQCVEVELFARYPLKKITAEKSTPPEAAKAMTVAIRTFLQQNANREGDCLTIPDSSATQRVSASPATTGARTMTAWTQDLIYAGDPVHYHGSRATEGTLSWRQATAQAGQGERYDQILAFAYPDNSLSRWGAPRSTCQLLPKAKAWLAKKMPQWRRILQGETGYNEPDVFAVCRLVSGFPYTDRQQKRLFIRNFFTLQDRLDLTHEYLHLAFDGYPTGLDENYIETLTRQLLMD
ncbi:YfaQ family protein [Escherichia coli]